MYLIDGYNFIFHIDPDPIPIERSRAALLNLIASVQPYYKKEFVVVFDGQDPHKDFFSKTLFVGIEVVFTPSSQSADNFIIEFLETHHTPADIQVISSDKKLRKHCHHLGAQTESTEKFIRRIHKKHKHQQSPLQKPQEEKNVSYWCRIFSSEEDSE